MAKPDWGAIQKQFLADHAITNISPKDWCDAQGINYAAPRRYVKNHPLMLLLAVSGCNSMQHVSERTKRPAPPAWMMAPAPDLLTPLNGIISISESESERPQSK